MEILQGNTALFNDYEIGAFVLPIIQGKTKEDPVDLGENGTIQLSLQESKEVTGFRLGLIVPKDARVVIVQRNLGHSPQRLYHQFALSTLKEEEWDTWIMMDHMKVYRKDWGDGRRVTAWTVWQATVPNRVDLWFLTPGGLTRLFQVGVICRGEGENQYFRLLGELRGEWQLCHDTRGVIVGVPTKPVWGAFDIRRPILKNPDFVTLLKTDSLPSWDPEHGILLSGNSSLVQIGESKKKLDYPLKLPLESNRAVMEWWSLFTGMRGQGPIGPNGSNTWVCGEDFLGEPDPDGIVRLPRGTIVSYKGMMPLGTKAQKLLRVRRV